MKIAVLSDAHGNRRFFERVFCEVQSECPDSMVYLGDIFGYMPYGREILEVLRIQFDVILKGNHEAMLLGEQCLDALSPEYQLDVDGKTILFMHGSPLDRLAGYLYEDCPDYEWELPGYDYVFMGHTHRPYVKTGKHTVFVNVGSCGLPRDVGLSPSYVLFDTDSGRIDIKRVIIDTEVLEDPDYREVSQAVLDVFQRGGK